MCGNRRFITAFTTARRLSPFSYIHCNTFTLYGEFLEPRPTQSCRTTCCRLFATAFSVHSHLPFCRRPFLYPAKWGRAIPWRQKPTYQNAKYLRHVSLAIQSSFGVRDLVCCSVVGYIDPFQSLFYTDKTNTDIIHAGTGIRQYTSWCAPVVECERKL